MIRFSLTITIYKLPVSTLYTVAQIRVSIQLTFERDLTVNTEETVRIQPSPNVWGTQGAMSISVSSSMSITIHPLMYLLPLHCILKTII